MGLCFGKNKIKPIHTSNEPERIPPLRRMNAVRRIPSRQRSITIYNEDELLNSVIVNDHFIIKK